MWMRFCPGKRLLFGIEKAINDDGVALSGIPPAQRNAFRLDAASTIQIVRLYESTVAVLFTGEPNGDAVANSSIDTIASCFPLTL